MKNRFLWMCLHEWEPISEVRVREKPKDEIPIAINFILKCKHCGDMKTFKVKS